MKKNIINIIKLLFCILVFLYVGDFYRLFLKVFNIKVLTNKGEVISQFILSLLLFILLLLLYNKTFKKDYNRFKKNYTNNLYIIIRLFLIFIVLKYFTGMLSSVIMVLLGYDVSYITSVNQELILAYVKANPILMIISSSFIAPFYEEGLFRLGFKKVFNNKWLFIIISGSLFGFLHVFPLNGLPLIVGLVQSILYVIMGMVLSYIYYKYDNIYMSIGVHFLNNLLSMLIIIKMI